ncbi:hypothetical protein N9Y37_05615 [Luminiphilus sp.]|nr:hypothetical protein [Luminiphilus sp.]
MIRKEANQLIALILTATIALASGCASSGGYSVGPNSGQPAEEQRAAGPSIEKPFMVVAVFDPNIPEDPNKIEKEAIWPELRRTEAVRLAKSLTGQLSSTGAFDGVRTTPDTETSAHLYTQGKILKSNGEELDLDMEVVSIQGDQIFKKSYRFKVDEYMLADPRKGRNSDLYEDFMEEIAVDIAAKVNRLKADDLQELARVEELRYAEFFEPNFSDQYLAKNWMGELKVVSYPSPEDPMMRRIESLKIKDQMFIDALQNDYQDFSDTSNAAYTSWQRAAYTESKAAREAKNKAAVQGALGVLLMAGAVAAGNNAGYNDYGTIIGATALGVGGLKTIQGAMGNSRQAKAHKETLSELGKSLNTEIAPKVMELEETQVELKGTAQEQYATWRSALREIYKQETVPNVAL